MEVESDSPEVTKPKPKIHIWSQILLEDELSEQLSSSMNAFGDGPGFGRKKFKNQIKKKKKKNKKKKKEEDKSGPMAKSKEPAKAVIDVAKNGDQSKPNEKPPTKPKKIPYPMVRDEATKIAKKLSNEKRIDLIMRVIRFIGLEEAWRLCSEVLTVEEAGGLMTMNAKRRRTPGGIYFHIIRSSGRYDTAVVEKIFREDGEKKEPTFKRRIKPPTEKRLPVAEASQNGTVEMVEMEITQFFPKKPVAQTPSNSNGDSPVTTTSSHDPSKTPHHPSSETPSTSQSLTQDHIDVSQNEAILSNAVTVGS